MGKMSKWAVLLAAGTMAASIAVPVGAAAAPVQADVKTDAQTASELGVLQGDGGGVTAAYLAKPATRLQAAILFLRLKGLEQAALAFKGSDNFADAGAVSDGNKAVLGYLKAHPELGWTGMADGKFDPAAGVTAQQYYKVLLEALGYKQDTDFTYAEVLAFAAKQRLSQTAEAGALRNSHIATATVEALQANVKGGAKTLAAALADQKVIDPAKAAALQYARIGIASAATGAYLTDAAGRTLYTYTKDMPDMSMCQDQCAVNWPIFYAERIQVPAGLSGADFKTIEREDGKKQTSYKGMPLYYFAKDEKAGDVKGQGVNQVWHAASYSGVAALTDAKLGTYLADSQGMALYLYTKDTPGVSVCKGSCETAWPIFYSPNVPAGTDWSAADFGVITREDGTKQSTYKGWPLYYYVKDEKAGEVKGQGVGGVWYVIDPRAGTKEQAAAEQKEQGTSAVKPGGKAYAMDIKNFAFAEEVMTIETGSSITFTNRDFVQHNVVSDATEGGKPLFSTPLLSQGESFTLTFDKPGEYTYYCEPHQDMMKGKIIVK